MEKIKGGTVGQSRIPRGIVACRKELFFTSLMCDEAVCYISYIDYVIFIFLYRHVNLVDVVMAKILAAIRHSKLMLHRHIVSQGHSVHTALILMFHGHVILSIRH